MKMSLAEYLFKNKLSVKEFGEKIGYCQQYISALKLYRSYPGKKARDAIDKLTNGQITFDKLLAEEYKPRHDDYKCPHCQRKIPKKWIQMIATT